MSKLKDIAILITKGTTPSTIGEEFTDKGINYVKSESITDSKYLNSELFEHITEETHNKLRRSQLKKDDLLFTIAGAYLGKLAIVREENLPLNTNQAVGVVRIDSEKADSNYIYYYFSQKHINKYINSLSSQSSQPNLNLKLLGNLEYKNKDLKEQKQISSILSSIDDKIENNNKINEELESMAKTIYDYWFLQFDFPDENGKPYKSSGGKMIWNEELKKEIPEGWEVKSLLELSDLNNNINYDKNENGDKEYKIVNVRNITASTLLINNMDLDLINLKSSLADKYLVEEDDILIARSGTPGAVRLIEGKNNDIIYCGFIIRCKPKRAELRYYLTYLLKIYEGSHVTKTGGSIMQNVSQNTLSQLQICVPSDKVLYMYNQKIKLIISMMQSIIKENQTLKELRDFLLPLLMNGQLGFKEK